MLINKDSDDVRVLLLDYNEKNDESFINEAQQREKKSEGEGEGKKTKGREGTSSTVPPTTSPPT